MKCIPVRSPDGKSTGFVCTSRRMGNAPRCVGSTCGHAPSVALCDYPFGAPESETCSRRICAQHRTRFGKYDACPPHAEAHRQAVGQQEIPT